MSTSNANMQEGLAILFVGLVIIFISLLILFMVFQFVIPWVLSLKGNRKRKGASTAEDEGVVRKFESGEEIAAVSIAIYLFIEEAHDEENAILTISKSAKNYSPWSSKIYVTHNLRKWN